MASSSSATAQNIVIDNNYQTLSPGLYTPTFADLVEPKLYCMVPTNQEEAEILGVANTTSGPVNITIASWQNWSTGIDKTIIESFELYTLSSGRTVQCLLGW